jgi:rod shape-determining protein mreD|nr:rod shape-determining protein MreD [uncultured Capnocytophaga sp.]
MSNLFYLFQLLCWVLLQGIVLNHINLFGYVNPPLYLVFFMSYPLKENKSPLFFMATLAGLIIDIFSHTGGIYACATLCIVFLRPLLVRLFFGKTFEDLSVNLLQVSFTLRILYISSFILIFYLVFSLLETFQWELWLFSSYKTLISTAISILISLFTIQLLGDRK